MTATRIADLAAELGPAAGLEVEVFDRDELLELQCGGIIAVNGGSAQPPRMVKLTYRPEGADGRTSPSSARASCTTPVASASSPAMQCTRR